MIHAPEGVGTRDASELSGIWGCLCGLLVGPKHNMHFISCGSYGFEACLPHLSSGDLEGLAFAFLRGRDGRYGDCRGLAGVCGLFALTLL